MFQIRSSAAFALCALALAAACSDEGSPPAAVSDAGTDAALTVQDAGPASDAETPTDDAGTPDHVGAIFAISDISVAPDGGARSSHRAGANFRHITRPDGMVTEKTVGPCLVEVFAEGDSEQSEGKSAGVVRIEGGVKPIALSPKPDGTYGQVSGNTTLWAGGESLTIRADGSDVPAFSASLVAPSKVILTAPAVPSTGLVVTKATGLAAKFSGTQGTVVLYFGAAAGTKGASATCSFKAESGVAEVPAAAFADFPSGPGTYDFYVKETATVAPAGWAVRITASSALVDGAGSIIAGDATFK
jgi:hypothetical protein